MFYLNIIDLKILNSECYFLDITGDENKPPKITYNLDAVGTFSTEMDLRRFPFDVQSLTLELTSAIELPGYLKEKYLMQIGLENESFAGYRIELLENSSPVYPSLVKVRNFPLKNEYVLQSKLQIVNTKTDSWESSSGRQYSLLQMSIKVSRVPAFWLQNIVLPSFLITSASFSFFRFHLLKFRIDQVLF